MTGQLTTVLVCSSCQRLADLSKDPHAWDSWSFGKATLCPNCNGLARVLASQQPRAQVPILETV